MPTTPFDPTTNAADAYAVVSDTAPVDFWWEFSEARLVARCILIRDYLKTRGYEGVKLAVLRDTAHKLAGTSR